VVVDGGPHPNPRKTAEGHRLRVLVIDEETPEIAGGSLLNTWTVQQTGAITTPHLTSRFISSSGS